MALSGSCFSRYVDAPASSSSPMSNVSYLCTFPIQDTNALVFRALPSALGVSVKNNFEMNSITVPRRPGEAVGGICTLKSDEKTITINVEYNQLDPLLRSTISPDGDLPDESGLVCPHHHY